MDFETAFLAATPPALAAFAEWCNPINKASIQSQAVASIDELGLAEEAKSTDPVELRDKLAKRKQGLVDVTTGVARGAVSVASLIPTGIAVLTAAVAVINEFPGKFWFLDILLLVTVCCTIWILKILGGISYLDIATVSIGRFNSRAEWFSRLIYIVNGLLIVLIFVSAIMTYLKEERHPLLTNFLYFRAVS